MVNRVCLLAATAAVLTLSNAQVSFAQTVSYNFTVDVISGPFENKHYTGITSVDLSNLSEDTTKTRPPTSILFDFGGVEFTDANDVRDADADSPRANFHQNDSFVGITYIVSRFGEMPTEIPLIDGISVDGFAIDNNDFGYIVGTNLYRGTVNYTLPANPENGDTDNKPEPQPVSEPSFWFGLATVGYWLSRRTP